MVKAQKKFEQQLNVWDKEFKPFMDRVVDEALKLYENLHAWMDNMEEHINNRLRELLILDLARIINDLKQEHTDIVEFKIQLVTSMFDPAFVEINGEEYLVDLIGKLMK